MMESTFVPTKLKSNVTSGKVTWKTPSNIALVKYWGKREPQLPENASISFTLSNCTTVTTIDYQKKENTEGFSFDVFFEGEKKDAFKPKIATFFKRIEAYIPFLKEYHFTISSKNSFPHSSGIASSASGMSAIALCLMSMEREMNPEITDAYFYRKASFLARLGSGSACRSIKGELVVWGAHPDIKESSDNYGVAFEDKIDKIFTNYQDTILLIDKGEKQVSSTVGHNLMHNHPFSKQRFAQAQENITKLKDIFATGEIDDFIALVESEALTLHAMMMTSHPYFILMKPNTLEVLNRVWAYRKKTGSKLCFTLDAGANVHLLYPKNEKESAQQFIAKELAVFCKNGEYIHDLVGMGAEKVSQDSI